MVENQEDQVNGTPLTPPDPQEEKPKASSKKKEESIQQQEEKVVEENVGERDEYSNLVTKFSDDADSAVESFQEEGNLREATHTSGIITKVAPRKIEVASIYIDSRAGTFLETNDEGIVVSPGMTATKKDNRGRKRRQRFFVGTQVEAVTMDWVAKSTNLRRAAKDPKDFEITSQVMQLLAPCIEESQKAGDTIDRKILEENYDWFPIHFDPPLIKTVADDIEPEPNVYLMKGLVTTAYEIINEKLGAKIDKCKVIFSKFSEFSLYADSLGSQTDQVIPRVSFIAYVKTKEGSEAFGAIRGAGGTIEECLRRYSEKGDDRSLEEIIKEFCETKIVAQAVDLDRTQNISILGSECPVILSPEAAGVLAHEVFGHCSEGDIIADNHRDKTAKINLKSRLGSQVSDNSKFNVIDTPYKTLEIDKDEIHRFNWGYINIDGHGSEAKTCHIVENGIMVEAMTDRYSHEEVIDGLKKDIVDRMNKRGLSGNVRRENYSKSPQVRMRNTFILPDSNGPSDPQSMATKFVPKTKKGIYMKSCNGGWVQPIDGTWMLYGNLCYLIENGQITDKPLRNVQITGNIGKSSDLIKSIGNKKSMEGTFTGVCGKSGQWVPVEGAGPIIYMENVSVGSAGPRYWLNIVDDFSNQYLQVEKQQRGLEEIYLEEIAGVVSQDKACLCSAILPAELEGKLWQGGYEHPTHEAIWNEETKSWDLVERNSVI